VTHERHIRGDLNRGRPGLERLGAARAAARALCATAGQTVLLHGDFLDKNLLRARHGYVAIDPLPQLGDPCADVGFFAAGHSWREDQQSLDELLDSDKFERLLRD